LPVGTDIEVTDSLTNVIEHRVMEVLGEDNPMVESVIANVGIGAGDPFEGGMNSTPHKGKVSVAFVEYAYRNSQSTRVYLDKIRDAVQGIPGAVITVEQENMGPPTGKPVNIEISGDDIDQLAKVSSGLKNYLDSLQVPGVEELKSDFESSLPEMVIHIDRDKARREGVSTGQIGMEIRSAIFGKEVSKYREAEEEYPIMLRYSKNIRQNIDALLSSPITYMDMNMGGAVRQIPMSSLVTVDYSTTYGGINRKNVKRVIMLSSNILSGYTAQGVSSAVYEKILEYDLPPGIDVIMTGEEEDMKETQDFLGIAFLVAFFLIFLILVTQFNSVAKPIIILSEVVLSIIGVLLGFVIFDMQMSLAMTGFGIVGLGGIVVKNGILLIEFMDELQERGLSLRDAIVQGGKLRLKPVMLTAISTVLGLLALAIGFNIDFVTAFSELNPNIYFGGDNVVFFGPLSWTIIFGLIFATTLTLVLVPVMYYILYKVRERFNVGKKEG